MGKITAIILLCFLPAIAFSQAAQQAKSSGSKPFILGVVDELRSNILNEKRTLNIYLPDGYKEQDTVKYPVIYLLDGGAEEDFVHIAGLVQFSSFSWVGRLQPSIVVGIANTDRKRDFTYPTTITEDKKLLPTTGQSAKFIAFIETELQPFISEKYRTNTAGKTLIGESLGGLLATEVLLKHPQLFNRYIIVSPSLWWDDGSLLKTPLPQFNKGLEVYIAVGKESLTPGNIRHIMEVDANLLADKLKKTTSKSPYVYFDYLPDEDHATIAHQAILNAFKVLHTHDVK